jgi:(E)-4-hydroxy-3-methylbut-2-enyl-diphosphate synthase
MDYFNYSRREANEVYVGATPMGGTNPIRIQSMTNTVTMDTEACVEQAKRIIEAGGEYVRLTTQGVREAENLKNINIDCRFDLQIFCIVFLIKLEEYQWIG